MSDWCRDTPPEASSAVFILADSVIIDAPIEKVWSILLDFGSYKEWNPFVRNQTVVDAKMGTPLVDQTPSVGCHILMDPVHLPPTMRPSSELWFWQKNSTRIWISHLDKDNYRVAWRTSGPAFLLEAERWQMLTKTADGKVKYETFECFRGPLAYIVKFFVGHNLNKGVRAMAEGLKQRAEAFQ
ncbi:hypothetical protein V5O48_007510 [Marasmius crinis-equi]|uniref:Coenzyme Q-binding protein COQ10 START domain-containing protein n=1 Tax=Marasmius crinis-equi TaxID=585013 RepID=A0ABR3FGF8_9AGAR